MKYRLQSMYNHVVGRVVQVDSTSLVSHAPLILILKKIGC